MGIYIFFSFSFLQGGKQTNCFVKCVSWIQNSGKSNLKSHLKSLFSLFSGMILTLLAFVQKTQWYGFLLLLHYSSEIKAYRRPIFNTLLCLREHVINRDINLHFIKRDTEKAEMFNAIFMPVFNTEDGPGTMVVRMTNAQLIKNLCGMC